jgi:hypothetical protein
LVGWAGAADPGTKRIPVPPPARDIHPGVLNVAVRAALASGSERLLTLVETNYLNYAAPPLSTRKITDYERMETFEVRYRPVEVDEPIYENVYETYETFKVGDSQSVEARNMAKVTSRRVVGTKQVGTRKVQRLVQDPNGSVVKTHTRGIGPIYSPGAEYWADHLPGDNALALLALLKSGVPEDDERLVKLANAVNDYVAGYGTSDLTWNIAWLAAALSNFHAEDYRRARELAVSRILDGQILSGPARGMWGPVCINMEILPVLVKYEADMNAELTKLKAELPARLKETSSRKKQDQYSQNIEELETYIKSLEKLYAPVTQQGLRFNAVQDVFRLKRDAWENDERTTAGLPYDIYNQTLADLQSTALALYAIGQAAENGYLPKSTSVPDLSGGPKQAGAKGRRDGQVLKPQAPSGILARSVFALSQLQLQDGSWNQCNMHQEVRSFQAIGLPLLLPDEKPPSLPSVRTEVTSAEGYSCFVNAGKSVGMDKMFGKYGRNVQVARKRVIEDAEAYLDRKSENVIPLGRILDPYDLYFAMLGIHRGVYPITEDRRDLWMRFAWEIVETQDNTGAWEAPPRQGWPINKRRLHASSLWAWKPFSVKAKYERTPQAKAQPFDLNSYWGGGWYGFMGLRKGGSAYSIIEAINREVVCTSLCMLFLADGVYPPIAGHIAMDDRSPPPATLDWLCRFMKKKHRISATCLKLTPDNVRAAISSTPLVLVSGVEPLRDSSIADLLKTHLGVGTCTLVVESGSPAELTAAQDGLASLLPGASVHSLLPTVDFMAEYQGDKPAAIPAVLTREGRMAAIFVLSGTEATAPGAGAVQPLQYAQTLYLLARKLLGPEYFDPQYPSLYLGENPFVARVAALTSLRGAQLQPASMKTTPAGPETAGAPYAPSDKPASVAPAAQEAALPEDEVW